MDTTATLYAALNQDVLAMVPANAKRILDLGCGTGVMGQALKSSRDCQIVGVTYNAEEAAIAAPHYDQVITADLNDFQPDSLGTFDCMICSHVLEHLYRPHEVLERLRPALEPNGNLLIALPNVLFWRQRVQFLMGRFVYTDTGLMDKTHYRFFDWKTAQAMLTQSGFRITAAYSDGYLPLSKLIPPLQNRLNRWATRSRPGFFGFQFRFQATPA